ncbi:MAG: hypothetical protein AAF556_07525 [Pseudomonadota bacterium]
MATTPDPQTTAGTTASDSTSGGYDLTYVDLANRPGIGAGLRAWRARHFVKQLQATANDGPPEVTGDLIEAKLYDGAIVATFDRGEAGTKTTSYVDQDRIRSIDEESGAADVGPMTHLIVAHDNGFGLVYPDGDTTQRPQGFSNIYKALERVLATMDGQPLADLTEELTEKMADLAFKRAIPKHAYSVPKLSQ